MSNERIDLTQFEGMTEGTWHFCLPYNAETDTYEGDAQMKGGGDRVNGPVILSQYQFARGTVDHRADLRAMESCPELIAELKRCYEEIDKLRKQPVSISCEHCSHVYEEEYLHEMLEMGPNGECVMCLEEASE